MDSTIGNIMVPEFISGYNVYDNDGVCLIGISDEVTLPSFEPTTAAVSGAGILGEFEDAVLGQFKSMTSEIPFRSLYTDAFSLMSINTPLSITLRGTEQYMDSSTGISGEVAVKIVQKGKFKGFEAGKMKIGEGTGSKIKMELFYIKIEVDGKSKLELDKFNSVYKVNGVDQLANQHKFC